MGMYTSVFHPTAGEVQFKFGDDYMASAELGKRFVSISEGNSTFIQDIGLPPDGIHYGYHGRLSDVRSNWMVVVKDCIAVGLVPSVVPGEYFVDWDELPPDIDAAHHAQVAELVERYGVPSLI